MIFKAWGFVFTGVGMTIKVICLMLVEDVFVAVNLDPNYRG